MSGDPRVVLRSSWPAVGKQETAQARDLIEQWRQAYSNLLLSIVPYPTSPPAAPGGPDDPWRSPEE
jgi:hypothetical protein